jgi:hypothetical protein
VLVPGPEQLLDVLVLFPVFPWPLVASVVVVVWLFELLPTTGLMKDTLNMVRFTTAEIDFVADDPGLTLFHCHHQDHQDEGFMGLIHYT